MRPVWDQVLVFSGQKVQKVIVLRVKECRQEMLFNL